MIAVKLVAPMMVSVMCQDVNAVLVRLGGYMGTVAQKTVTMFPDFDITAL